MKNLFLGTLTVCMMSPAVAEQLPATYHGIQYEGRVIKDYAQGEVRLNWPGSQLKTQFEGRTLSLTLTGYGDQFDVLVDGEVYKKIKTDRSGLPQSFLVFSSEEPQAVEIEIVKRTENTQNAVIIHSVDTIGMLKPNWERQKHILFIGDSISAGMGSESTSTACTFDEMIATSNARVAFPYLTADALNASFTQISYSGLGLLRNWNGNQTHHTIRDYFNQFSAIYQDNRNFEDTHPNLIVIEIGTNDFSTAPQPHEPWDSPEALKSEWGTTMVSFIEQLRMRFGETPIVLMPRPAWPYDYIVPSTQDAVNQATSLGYGNIEVSSFNVEMNGCWGHPDQSAHLEIASGLVSFINKKSLL